MTNTNHNTKSPSIHSFDAYVIDEQEKRQQQAELSRLTDKLNAYCDLHGLPYQSADELLSELYCEDARREELCKWMRDFIDEWDAVA